MSISGQPVPAPPVTLQRTPVARLRLLYSIGELMILVVAIAGGIAALQSIDDPQRKLSVWIVPLAIVPFVVYVLLQMTETATAAHDGLRWRSVLIRHHRPWSDIAELAFVKVPKKRRYSTVQYRTLQVQSRSGNWTIVRPSVQCTETEIERFIAACAGLRAGASAG